MEKQIRKVRAGTLHIVDTETLRKDDGVSVGACCNGDCNQGRDCPEVRLDGVLSFFAAFIVAAMVSVGVAWFAWIIITFYRG